MSQLSRRGAVDMTLGSPMKQIVTFSLPLLAGNVFQQLYNMVDSIVVGNYVGSSALTAVGTGFPVVFLMASLFIGFSMGATVMIAQYTGAGDQDAAARTVDTLYSTLLLLIVPLSLLGVFLSGPLLTLIRVPAEAYEQAKVYCIVIFAGGVGSLGYNVNTGIMQGLGDSKTPLLFLAVSCVINIVLDLVFVLTFHLGVFGVALATILAQICSWIFGIFYINRKYPFLHIRFLQVKLDRTLLGQIVRLGVPSAIQQCQFSVAILIMQALITALATTSPPGSAPPIKSTPLCLCPFSPFPPPPPPLWARTWGPGGWTGSSRAPAAPWCSVRWCVW